MHCICTLQEPAYWFIFVYENVENIYVVLVFGVTEKFNLLFILTQYWVYIQTMIEICCKLCFYFSVNCLFHAMCNCIWASLLAFILLVLKGILWVYCFSHYVEVYFVLPRRFTASYSKWWFEICFFTIEFLNWYRISYSKTLFFFQYHFLLNGSKWFNRLWSTTLILHEELILSGFFKNTRTKEGLGKMSYFVDWHIEY